MIGHVRVDHAFNDIFQISAHGDCIFLRKDEILPMLAQLIQAIEQAPPVPDDNVVPLDMWSRKV